MGGRNGDYGCGFSPHFLKLTLTTSNIQKSLPISNTEGKDEFLVHIISFMTKIIFFSAAD